MGQYEVRSWVGWHHHITLALVALWFVTLERHGLGKKIPAITAAQVQEIFSELLRTPAPQRIAAQVNAVLRRNEEACIYAWHEQTGGFPPRHPSPKGPPGSPRKSGYSRTMLKLHPEILVKNGKKEFVVLPYEEFRALPECLADAEDLLELRKAKRAEGKKRTLPLAKVKEMLGLP